MSTTESVGSVKVESVFAEYLPDTIEGEADVETAFRDAVQELHPDQSSGDTADEFDTVRKARDDLKEQISDGRKYQVETQASLSDIDIEDTLEKGIEWKDSTEDYDVDFDAMNGNMSSGLYSAVLDDNNSELMIGLEIEPDYSAPDEVLDVEATYFTDSGDGQHTESAYVDLRQEVSKLGYDEVNRETMIEAVESGIGQIGSWAAEYAEESLK